MTPTIDVLHSTPWAFHLMAWFVLNLIPFSVIGILLIVVAVTCDRHPRRARLLFGVLLAALLASTGCATVAVYGPHAVTVVYDYCNDPNIPSWLWWLTCAIH